MKRLIIVLTLFAMPALAKRAAPTGGVKAAADIIVVGKILKASHKDEMRASGYVVRYHDLEVSVKKIEKGAIPGSPKSIQISVWGYIKYPTDPSKRKKGTSGHDPIYTRKGTKLRLFLHRYKSGELSVIEPNGMKRLLW